MPTTRQRALRRAADKLDPAQALDTIDTAAGRVTASVPVAAALIGAFGLVSAAELENVGPGWALPCLVAAALSAITSVWATLPVRSRLRPGDLSAVEWWYARQAKRRWCLLRVAAMSFAVAVITAVLPALVSAVSSDDPTVDQTITWDASSGEVSAEVSIREAPSTGVARVTLTASGRTLAFAQLDVPSSGNLTRSILSSAQAKRPLTLTTVLRDDGEVLEKAEASVR